MSCDPGPSIYLFCDSPTRLLLFLYLLCRLYYSVAGVLGRPWVVVGLFVMPDTPSLAGGRRPVPQLMLVICNTLPSSLDSRLFVILPGTRTISLCLSLRSYSLKSLVASRQGPVIIKVRVGGAALATSLQDISLLPLLLAPGTLASPSLLPWGEYTHPSLPTCLPPPPRLFPPPPRPLPPPARPSFHLPPPSPSHAATSCLFAFLFLTE